ncbi:MAG: cytochrome c oxidase subunit II [Planctomycetota bacterium]
MIFRFKKILATLALAATVFGCSAASAKEQWEGWWLPEGVSSYSASIDNLFYFILALTGVVFLITEALLLVFVIIYRKQDDRKSFYTHGSHTLEMVWTITPAVTLIFIALVQARTWNTIKSADGFPDHKANPNIEEYVHVQLFAEQFSWYFRYPEIVTDKDGKKSYKYGVPGTFTTDRVLTVPKGKTIIVEMTSKDVIHSFFLPYMRLKQDVVPGMMIRCWFDASKTTAEMRETRPEMMLRHPGKMVEKPSGEKVYETPLVNKVWDYPIVCAELCGIQHYQMWGRVKVLEQAEYDAWRAGERAKVVKDANGDIAQEEQPIFAKYWQVNPETQQRIYGKSKEDDADGTYNKRSALVPTVHHEEHGAAKKDDGKKDAHK